MAVFTIPNVKIAGLSACVPKQVQYNLEYEEISVAERNLLIKTTGIKERRVADKNVTTSDLCLKAGEQLIEGLQWDKKDIEILIFVSQSRDYFLPATAIILQDKLGLPKTSLAFDISLGCSGYVYGLSTIASLMTNMKAKKGLLMVGDISTSSLNIKDKSTYPLFGDAGTVTALEYNTEANDLQFNLQSDGSGHEAIIIPDGGLRNPLCEASYVEEEIEPGITRSRRNLKLNGLDVFNFSLREVASNIDELCNSYKISKEKVDYYVLHQANLLMNESIRKKLKVEKEKVPYTLAKYGNTSSASIPLTIVSELRNEVENESLNMILSGFGVGLSWGALHVTTNKLVCPAVIEYE